MSPYILYGYTHLDLPADIDECAEDDHVCAHNCHNSVGSHSCSCNAGYRLNPDGRNCDGEYRK